MFQSPFVYHTDNRYQRTPDFRQRIFYITDLKDNEFYYITACADRGESTADFAIAGFRGFVMCLPNPTERGMIKATGVGMKGSVKNTDFMRQAYELGKGI